MKTSVCIRYVYFSPLHQFSLMESCSQLNHPHYDASCSNIDVFVVIQIHHFLCKRRWISPGCTYYIFKPTALFFAFIRPTMFVCLMELGGLLYSCLSVVVLHQALFPNRHLVSLTHSKPFKYMNSYFLL